MPKRILKLIFLNILLLAGCAGTTIRVGSPSEQRVPGGLNLVGFIGEGNLRHPLGMTTDPWGNLYIADNGDYRIKKFDLQGNLLRETEVYGQGGEGFCHPVDLSFGGDLRLYVLDGLTGEVQVLDRELGFLFTLGENSTLKFPSGLALDRCNRIFLTDSRQEGLLLLSSEEGYKKLCSAPGILLDPTDLAVDPQGKIYVTDGTGRLLVFDFAGSLIDALGEGILNQPIGVALNGPENIWVTDRSAHSIFLLSPQGKLMGRFPLPFIPGRLEIFPPDDRLWIVDQSEARVALYQLSQ